MARYEQETTESAPRTFLASFFSSRNEKNFNAASEWPIHTPRAHRQHIQVCWALLLVQRAVSACLEFFSEILKCNEKRSFK